MKKGFLLILAIMGVTALSPGAIAASEAEKAAAKVVKDAQKGDYNSYRKDLIGKTGERYGDMTTFQNIHSASAGYKKLETHQAIVTAGHGFRIYNVDIYAQKPKASGDPSSVYVTTATVQCAVDRNYEPGFCYGGWGWGWGWGMGDCFPGQVYNTERCSVTSFQNNNETQSSGTGAPIPANIK